MYCKYCGKLIADDSRFCQHCGKSLATVEEKSVEKENYRGGTIGQYVVKNKQTFLVYAIWLVLNILLYCFGQSPEYYIKHQYDYFYPFTLNDYTTLFYVGYYDITEFIVYVILIPLLLYFYINILNKPRENSKKKAKSKPLDYGKEYKNYETFHHDSGVKIEVIKPHKTEREKRDWSLSRFIPNILKPLICPFLSPGGVLTFVVGVIGIIGMQFSTELGCGFLFVAIAAYPPLLLEYLDKDEAEQLFNNQHVRRAIMSFLSKIVLFESMFMSKPGAYFICSVSIILVETTTTMYSSGMMQLGVLGAILSFIYIVYKYIKAIDNHYH